MKFRVLAVSATLALSLLPVTVASPAQAARCVSGAEVRMQVATFVHSLKDDVAPTRVRAAIRGALKETTATIHGARADTRKENRGLGKEISALASTLEDATDQVERKAIITEIHALQLQKRGNNAERNQRVATLRSDVKTLGRAIAKRTDTHAEKNQVAEFVHAFMAQFAC